MILYLCDGCKIKMSPEDLVDYQKFKAACDLPQAQMAEIFCSECRVHALEFWNAKSEVVQEAHKRFAGTLENFHNRFWQATKAKLKEA